MYFLDETLPEKYSKKSNQTPINDPQNKWTPDSFLYVNVLNVKFPADGHLVWPNAWASNQDMAIYKMIALDLLKGPLEKIILWDYFWVSGTILQLT